MQNMHYANTHQAMVTKSYAFYDAPGWSDEPIRMVMATIELGPD